MPARDRKDLFPGALEMMVLQILQQQPHASGTLSCSRFSGGPKICSRSKRDQLYPALQRMLKDGRVRARWSVSASGRRVRIYEVTAAGARHLDREILSFEQLLEGIRLVLAPVKP